MNLSAVPLPQTSLHPVGREHQGRMVWECWGQLWAQARCRAGPRARPLGWSAGSRVRGWRFSLWYKGATEVFEQELPKCGSHLDEDLVWGLVGGLAPITWWESLLGAAKGGRLRCRRLRENPPFSNQGTPGALRCPPSVAPGVQVSIGGEQEARELGSLLVLKLKGFVSSTATPP